MIVTEEAAEVVYEPRGAAAQLWRCKAPEVLVEGPAGTGKTRAILEKIIALADEKRYAGSRHLLCRKTRESMTDSVLVTLEEKVLPPGCPLRAGPARQNRHSYRFPNGSEIVVGGLDKPERTFSAEYDTVTVFEAIEASENEWELLHRALRNGKMPYQQAIADTNPGAPSHWLNQRANAGKMIRLLSRYEDNPELWDHEAGDWTEPGRKYIARLDALSGHRRLRLRLGKWAAAEGVVYEEFDTAVHLVNPFPIPASWRRVRSIDFGYTNPFVCQWWAIDPDGRMYLYRERYKTRTLVEDHAKAIRGLSAGERFDASVSDHDAEDRATLGRHGVPTLAAFKSISLGIEAVQARLRPAGDRRPRLFLFRDALTERDELLADGKLPLNTEQEFGEYQYPKGQDGKPLKEDPLKVNDHGMDAMRYAVAYVDRINPERAEYGGGGYVMASY